MLFSLCSINRSSICNCFQIYSLIAINYWFIIKMIKNSIFIIIFIGVNLTFFPTTTPRRRRDKAGEIAFCCCIGHVRPEHLSDSRTLWRLECAMAVSFPSSSHSSPHSCPRPFSAAARKMDNRPPFSSSPTPNTLHLCPQIWNWTRYSLWEMLGRGSW